MDYEIFDTYNIEEQELLEFEFDYLSSERAPFLSRDGMRERADIVRGVSSGSGSGRERGKGANGRRVRKEASSIDRSDMDFDCGRRGFHIPRGNKLQLIPPGHDGCNL